MFGYVVGLPWFLAYFLAGVLILFGFAFVYAWATPHDEMALIRSGNGAAVTAYLGALLGFSLPLASAAANSVSIGDFVVWAIIGMLIQVGEFFIAKATMSDLPGRITRGELSAGAWTGGLALAVGILNAACMTY